VCELCTARVDRRTVLRRAALATTAASAGLWFTERADARSSAALPNATAKSTTTTTTKSTSRTTRSASGKSIAAPTIIPRADWGADEAVRTNGRAFAPIRKILIHHTGSTNNPSDPAAEIRSIYLFHVLERGYVDIGYNFIIDHRGRIYEGRWALNYGRGVLHTEEDESGRGVMGAHAAGFNAGVSGIALLGEFTTGARPTTAAVDSLVNLIAWEASRHQIDPTATERFIPLFGAATTFANIAAHSAVGDTACPGAGVTALIPSIRTRVRDLVGSFSASTVNIPATIRFRGDARAALSLTPVTTTKPTTATTKSTAQASTSKTTVKSTTKTTVKSTTTKTTAKAATTTTKPKTSGAATTTTTIARRGRTTTP
jgi:hypothetical protein